MRLVVFVLLLANMNILVADDTLNSLWRGSFVPAYTEPSRSEFKRAKKLFNNHFAGEEPSQLESSWRELGYELIKWQESGRDFYVLREIENQRLGRGFFVFPADGAHSRLVLQIPHGKTDLYTGKIGTQLMVEHVFIAGIWNTAPRRYDKNDVSVNADMGKHTNSYFAAFTEALGAEREHIVTIQLHGFSGLNRTTVTAANADVIISPGMKKANSVTDAYHTCLHDRLGKNVLLFPRDVNELGGTLNISGKILRKYGWHEFVHLELSKGLRTELKKHRKSRAHLIDCLQ